MMILLIVLLVLATIANFADSLITVREIKTGLYTETGWPTKFIVGSKPTAIKMYGIAAVTSVIIVVASIYAYQWPTRWCVAPAIAELLGHTYAVYHNLRQL